MESRKKISRASSASVLPSGRWQDAIAPYVANFRPASASSLNTCFSTRTFNIPSHLQTNILKRHYPEWALSDLNLSPNIRKAVAIAAKQAYKSIQRACKDSSRKQILTMRKENRADLSLDRFLDNIRSVKEKSSMDLNTTFPAVCCKHRNTLVHNFLSVQKTEGKSDQMHRKMEIVRPLSASFSRRASEAKGLGHRQSDSEKIANDAVLERRERIRNRSLHVELHVLGAQDRIRRARKQQRAEIDSIIAAFESKRIGESFDCQNAVLTAKHRIHQWKANRKDDT